MAYKLFLTEINRAPWIAVSMGTLIAHCGVTVLRVSEEKLGVRTLLKKRPLRKIVLFTWKAPLEYSVQTFVECLFRDNNSCNLRF